MSAAKKIGVQIFLDASRKEKRSRFFSLHCKGNEYEELFSKINEWVSKDNALCVILEVVRQMVLTKYDEDMEMEDELDRDYIFDTKDKVTVKLVPKKELMLVSISLGRLLHHFGLKAV